MRLETHARSARSCRFPRPPVFLDPQSHLRYEVDSMKTRARLVALAVAAAVHLAMGWIYLFVSPLCLPRHPAVTVVANPFA